MKAVFINFASNNSSLEAEACFALVSKGKTVAYTPVDHRIGDAGLMPLLEDVLQKAGWTYADLTHIACIVGPGGFTSLRMAVTLANVLADQLKIPVCGIHLSDLYAARNGLSVTGYLLPGNPLIWFHSTKKDALFVRTFGIENSPWVEPTLITIEDLKAKSQKLKANFSGELIPDHRSIVDSLNLTPATLKPIADVLPAFLASQTFASGLLHPWYGRGW